MARTLPTEESLGLSPTEEEMATTVAPSDDDEVPIPDDDEPAEPEKAAKPEAEPEGKAEPAKAEEKPAEDESKTVDLRALQEARREAREARQQAAVLEQRWNEFIAAQNAPKQQEKPAEVVPKFNEDPIAAGAWTQEQLLAMQQEQQRTATERAEAQRAEQEWQQTFQKVDADYTASVKEDPTIAQAYDALRESQGKELLAMGFTIPEAREQLSRMEREHVSYVASRGIPIGDYIKGLAAARGWQPTAAVADPAATTPAKTDLAAVAAAQQRHQSLSDAPGGESIAPTDAKALAKMSDKDFKAWMSKKGNEQKFDEIMGA